MQRVKSNKGQFQKKEMNVFLILVFAIFVSETLIMLILRYLPEFSTWGEAILDSTILSCIIFPVIYIFLIKPLRESITERNRNEQKFRSLIENMGEGVVICDADERFIFVNAAAEKLFGAEKGSLIGQRLDVFFSAENFDFIVRQTEERKKGISSFYETEIILHGETKKNVFVTASPQFENGTFTGTLAIFRDISDLKKAEEDIKYERNLLRTLIDNLPDAVYVKDRDFRKVIANPVDVQYMGLNSEEEAIGKRDADVYNQQMSDRSLSDEQKVFETGNAYLNHEDYFIDHDGTEHWMLNSKVPIKDAEGKITGLVGIGREITERKKEEIRLKLFESVITNATDGVIITKIDNTDILHYKIIFVNNAYCKMTGYTFDEVVGKTPSILQGANTDKAELARIRESLKRFEPCKMEVINYKKDGTEFWSSIAFSPIADNNGRYTHWIAIKRDITERKKLEQNYIKAKERAESASKAKSEFLANMSHEIRTPLNSVIGFSDLLRKTQLDETQEQYNTAVFQSANSLLDIISEILDFSKIEAGKLEIDIVKTDILDLSYQIADMISYLAYKKKIELLLNIDPDLPRFIWTDPVRLRQILINLLGNAVKFTSTGEIELKIAVTEKKSDKHFRLRFSVRDTGIGIDTRNQQKIFEPFSQEDSSTSRKYGGTGLGLTISQQLLELMGSNLQLISTLNIGSTFYFDMDLEVMNGEPENWEVESVYKRILIVDDNANNRLLLKDMLLLQGIQSDEADNGMNALKLLSDANTFDMILMDFNMPGIDGIETIRQIRETLHLSAQKQPVILLHSSSEDEMIQTKCEQYEVAGRLVKPIKIHQLFDLMSRVGHGIKKEQAQIALEKSPESVKSAAYRVLLVDDNELNIMLIKKIVSQILPNAVLYEATNGKQAVDQYLKVDPDIIFMDIQMPEMNGHDATRAIRIMEKNRHIPIIALTAGTLTQEREMSIASGMNDFVTKPFVSTAIADVVDKWL